MTEYKDYSLPETRFDDMLLDPSFHADTSIGADTPVDVAEEAMRSASVVEAVDNLALTANSAVAYKSSLSSCVDFFYKIQQTTDPDAVNAIIDAAWTEDPLITLRLIFQLRDIRNGKGIKRPFLYCLEWLLRHHFKTLLTNLKHVTDVGCWKDTLDLLVIKAMSMDAYQTRLKKETKRARAVKKWVILKSDPANQMAAKKQKKGVYGFDAKIDKDAAAAAARMVFLENERYRQLHVCIASLFAEALKKDLVAMNEKKGVSLASKWAPTACKHHDKFTLIVSTISQILFPQSEYRKENQSYEAYASAVRNLYRKKYLSPLRQYSNVVERYMSLLQWNDIPYDKVPSKAMLRNKHTFEKRDAERFKKYLEDVEKGKKTIKSSALNPHELIEPFLKYGKSLSEDEEMTTELQWTAYVTNLKEKGLLGNCMAMCDVSGSMFGLPLCVAVSLSLLVAELAEEPYKNLVLTFSGHPELFRVPEAKLRLKVEAVKGMNWMMNTNINSAFGLILRQAIIHKIPKEAMVKRLFIFSDMQFDAARGGSKTNFQAAKEKYEEAGYDLPQIVFWNLNTYKGDTTVPVQKDENGTALVSGFSGQLLKLFMNDDIHDFDPVAILMKAIECYDYLRVID